VADSEPAAKSIYEDAMTTIATTKEALLRQDANGKSRRDFRKELATLRPGRANASLLDNSAR